MGQPPADPHEWLRIESHATDTEALRDLDAALQDARLGPKLRDELRGRVAFYVAEGDALRPGPEGLVTKRIDEPDTTRLVRERVILRIEGGDVSEVTVNGAPGLLTEELLPTDDEDERFATLRLFETAEDRREYAQFRKWFNGSDHKPSPPTPST